MQKYVVAVEQTHVAYVTLYADSRSDAYNKVREMDRETFNWEKGEIEIFDDEVADLPPEFGTECVKYKS